MKVKFEMIIDYDPQGSTFNEIQQQLYGAAELLYDEGMLSGLLDAEVNECTHSVKLIEE